MRHEALSGIKKASSKIIGACYKLFLWLALLEDSGGPGTPTPQAAVGKQGLSLCSLPFGLSGSLCLTKLKFSAQRLLIFNRSHTFYKLVTHMISKLASSVPLLSCAAVVFILEKFWMSGTGKNSARLGACWSASKERCLTVLPDYKLGLVPSLSPAVLVLQSAV